MQSVTEYTAATQTASVNGLNVQAALAFVNPIVWKWFHEHENTVLRRIVFWTVRLRDLRFVIELIVGPESPA